VGGRDHERNCLELRWINTRVSREVERRRQGGERGKLNLRGSTSLHKGKKERTCLCFEVPCVDDERKGREKANDERMEEGRATPTELLLRSFIRS